MIKKKNKQIEKKLLTSFEMLQEALSDYLQNVEMPLTNSGSNILIITNDNIDIIIELHRLCSEGYLLWFFWTKLSYFYGSTFTE